jgi:hypothetical protein
MAEADEFEQFPNRGEHAGIVGRTFHGEMGGD